MTQYHLTCFGVAITGVQVFVDANLPGPRQIKHATRGPYFKRREKRLASDPKNYTQPSIVKLNGAYFCHPSAFEALKIALNSAT